MIYGFYQKTLPELQNKIFDMKLLGEKGHIEINKNEKGYYCFIVTKEFKNLKSEKKK